MEFRAGLATKVSDAVYFSRVFAHPVRSAQSHLIWYLIKLLQVALVSQEISTFLLDCVENMKAFNILPLKLFKADLSLVLVHHE